MLLRGPVLSPTSAAVVPADRRTLWQPGVTYNGGLPNYSTIFTTLSPSGGNDVTAIQTALDNAGAAASAGSPQVVKLNAGVFQVAGNPIRLRSSYVVLRGSGPGAALSFAANNFPAGPDPTAVFSTWPSGFISDGTATQIKKTDSATNANQCIVIGSDSSQFTTIGGGGTTLAADAPKGSFTLTLSSNPGGFAGGIFVGELIHIDQNTDNNSDVWWNPQQQAPASAGRTFNMRVPSYSLRQVLEVTAVDATKTIITFNTPLHTTFYTSQSAVVSRWNWADPNMPLVQWSGIEDLYCYGGTSNGNINIGLAKYCWAKHIESHWSDGGSVAFYSASAASCVTRLFIPIPTTTRAAPVIWSFAAMAPPIV